VSHQRVVLELLLSLAPFVRQANLGELLPAPMDVVLDVDAALVVQPDLLFVGRDRLHTISDRIYGAPDLVIEVLSPRPRIGELDARLEWFARYGVRECWLADLVSRRITVLGFASGRMHSRSSFAGAQALVSAVLPGLTLTPLQVFGL
jgi:Uma2 family endonuclease